MTPAVCPYRWRVLVGLGPWWEAGAKVESSFDLKTLIAIEVVTFAILEGFRVKAYEKTGEVGACRLPPGGCRSIASRLLQHRISAATATVDIPGEGWALPFGGLKTG